MKNTFGAFISLKRLEKSISLRSFADAVGISPVYASHIERNMRSAPSVPILKRISNILVLNSDEEEFYTSKCLIEEANYEKSYGLFVISFMFVIAHLLQKRQ